jgi:hypothetical protein
MNFHSDQKVIATSICPPAVRTVMIEVFMADDGRPDHYIVPVLAVESRVVETWVKKPDPNEQAPALPADARDAHRAGWILTGSSTVISPVVVDAVEGELGRVEREEGIYRTYVACTWPPSEDDEKLAPFIQREYKFLATRPVTETDTTIVLGPVNTRVCPGPGVYPNVQASLYHSWEACSPTPTDAWPTFDAAETKREALKCPTCHSHRIRMAKVQLELEHSDVVVRREDGEEKIEQTKRDPADEVGCSRVTIDLQCVACGVYFDISAKTLRDAITLSETRYGVIEQIPHKDVLWYRGLGEAPSPPSPETDPKNE